MTWFYIQIFPTSFSAHLLLVSIDTVKNCSGQNFMTFGTKTSWSWKSTQDDLCLHPNLTHIIFNQFVVISHEYDSKMFRPILITFVTRIRQSSKPSQTDLVLPKTFPTSFLRLIFGCFTSKGAKRTSGQNFTTLSGTKTTRVG